MGFAKLNFIVNASHIKINIFNIRNLIGLKIFGNRRERISCILVYKQLVKIMHSAPSNN
jgi:hypothetical protein